MVQALVIEMLGDVGEVHREVVELRSELAGVTQAVQRAADSAAGALRQAAEKAIESLEESTRQERMAAKDAASDVSLAIQSIAMASAHTTVQNKGLLDAHAATVLENVIAEFVKRSAVAVKELRARSTSAPDGRSWLLLPGILAAGLAAGGLAGWLLHPGLSSEEAIAIQAGRDVERAFAVLDPASRDKVVEAIKRTSRGEK